MAASFDLHTALGVYRVIPWPGDNRVDLPAEPADNQGPGSAYRWDPLMEAVLVSAARASRAQARLVVPGGFRITPDEAFQRVLERTVAKSGGQVPQDTVSEPHAATDRLHAVAAARRILEHLEYHEGLRNAVEAAEAICARTGGLKSFELALRAAEAEVTGELEKRAVRILTAFRGHRAHEASRRARRALLGVGEAMLPGSPDPVAELLAWWDDLPPAPAIG